MTTGELEQALVRAGVRRGGVQLQGIDEIRAPEEGPAVAVGSDEQGRWFWGRWDTYRPGLLRLEYRFETEGEACQSFYEDCAGPITMSPPLTLAQWRLQPAVVRDNQAAAARYDEELWRRIEEEPPRTGPDPGCAAVPPGRHPGPLLDQRHHLVCGSAGRGLPDSRRGHRPVACRRGTAGRAPSGAAPVRLAGGSVRGLRTRAHPHRWRTFRRGTGSRRQWTMTGGQFVYRAQSTCMVTRSGVSLFGAGTAPKGPAFTCM